MKRLALVLLGLLLFGAARLPAEHALYRTRAQGQLLAAPLDLDLREELGQRGFVAAFSGFRALIADVLFIQAYSAWERTDWTRLYLLMRQATALQPHNLLFWDTAAWHLAWNASAAALHAPGPATPAARRKTQREYIDLGREFLERGLQHNPHSPLLLEALARLYREKYGNHERAAEFYQKAAAEPGAPSYVHRFAAYELSYVEGQEPAAYTRLLELYRAGPQERLPTLIRRLKFLEERLNIPPSERIADELP